MEKRGNFHTFVPSKEQSDDRHIVIEAFLLLSFIRKRPISCDKDKQCKRPLAVYMCSIYEVRRGVDCLFIARLLGRTSYEINKMVPTLSSFYKLAFPGIRGTNHKTQRHEKDFHVHGAVCRPPGLRHDSVPPGR